MNELMNTSRMGRGTLNEFDRFLQSMLAPFSAFSPEILGSGTGLSRIEVEESERDVTAKLPLPGFKTKDIDVEVVGDMLTIRAKREDSCSGSDKRHYLKKERSCTEYEETIRLPVAVKGQDASAKFTDGVLTVQIPRESEQKQSHLIQVK